MNPALLQDEAHPHGHPHRAGPGPVVLSYLASTGGKGVRLGRQGRRAASEDQRPAPTTLEILKLAAAIGLAQSDGKLTDADAQALDPEAARPDDRRQPALRHVRPARPLRSRLTTPGWVTAAPTTAPRSDRRAGSRWSAHVAPRRAGAALARRLARPSRGATVRLARDARRAARRGRRRVRLRRRPSSATRTPPALARRLVDLAATESVVLARLVRRRPRADRRPGRRGLAASRCPPDVEVRRRVVGRAGRPAARPRRHHGPAALARRLPVGRRADPRDPGALPRRGGPRGARGDRGRRPRRTSPRSSATCCCRSSSTPGSPRSSRSDAVRHRRRRRRCIVEKLVRRHPHVFADGDAVTPAEVEQAWERIKAQEKAGRRRRRGRLRGRPAARHPRVAARRPRRREGARPGAAPRSRRDAVEPGCRRRPPGLTSPQRRSGFAQPCTSSLRACRRPARSEAWTYHRSRRVPVRVRDRATRSRCSPREACITSVAPVLLCGDRTRWGPDASPGGHVQSGER